MRLILVAALLVAASAAMADEIDDAHRQAITGRDTYWNCLAQEYSLDDNKAMSSPDFTSHIAEVCPSERQNFRVSLVDYLTGNFPMSMREITCRLPTEPLRWRRRISSRRSSGTSRHRSSGVAGCCGGRTTAPCETSRSSLFAQ